MQNRKEFSNSPLRTSHGDFPSGPVVMTNTGDTGLIPSGGTKIPHALGQLILCMAMKTQGSQKKNGAGVCVCVYR